MDKLIVEGGTKLSGSVNISGSKNASLPILAAALLTDEPVRISRVPDVSDTNYMIQILSQLEGKKVTIQRSKGLGENDPEMMWMTTMNPETRRLIKVMPEDAERTAHYFDVLLGDALAERKNFIAENGAKYLELADIS